MRESGLAAEKEFGKPKQKTPLNCRDILLVAATGWVVPPCLFAFFNDHLYSQAAELIQVK